MRLADFITTNIEPILLEWVAFARMLVPAAGNQSELALRDDAAPILIEIARDMCLPEDDRQRLAKSRGLLVRDTALETTPAHVHAMQRARSGFKTIQMVSEFRALRATVMRLWSSSGPHLTADDLDEVTRFNEAVDAALAESLMFFIAEVDRARNLFLGVLGHDLRTPLATIMSCTQHQLRARPENARESHMVLRSAAHMKALVDDLLEYTRSRLGVGVVVEPKPVQLDRLARETLEEIIAIHPGRPIELQAKGDAHGTWDSGRLHQVLSNLVINALKYGSPRTPIEVTVDGTEEDDVVLTVRNFGTPIPTKILPDLFEPLIRGSAVAATDADAAPNASIGLGLYIAREIVSAHAGTISVTSSADEGTRFIVRLPRHNASAA